MLLACTGDDASWVQALAKQGGSEGRSEGLTALAQAAALSVRSTHPVSQAVLACAQSAGSSLPQLQLQDFHQQPGVLSLVCYHCRTVLTTISLLLAHVRLQYMASLSCTSYNAQLGPARMEALVLTPLVLSQLVCLLLMLVVCFEISDAKKY